VKGKNKMKSALLLVLVLGSWFAVSGAAKADYVDPSCLDACVRDCGGECVGAGKAGCIQGCAAANDECDSLCLVAGEPPLPASMPVQPPAPACTIQDTRRCFILWFEVLPGTPFASCSGECTETCCSRRSDDQVLCGVSSCE
jgi:hypothetical protein